MRPVSAPTVNEGLLSGLSDRVDLNGPTGDVSGAPAAILPTISPVIAPVVLADSGPVWLQYLVAFGTLGAAIFAGAAAFAARRSTAAARDLIDLERGRDDRRAEEEFWRHARCVTAVVQSFVREIDGRNAYDVHLTVQNAGSTPILFPRIKLLAGGVEWGPQVLGALGPGQSGGVVVRIFTENLADDMNGFVGFADVNGNYWLRGARGTLAPSTEVRDGWVDDARRFAVQVFATPHERGSTLGAFDEARFDFEAWSSALDDGGTYSPPPAG